MGLGLGIEFHPTNQKQSPRILENVQLSGLAKRHPEPKVYSYEE